MTCPDTSMEGSHFNEKLRDLYLPGFLRGSRVVWLIDTGAARSVLSFKAYNSLPASVKFSLISANSPIALANGQQAKTYAVGDVVVRLGNSEFRMHVIVAEVEDKDILGMDFLSQVDSRIDIVKQQLFINGEVFDCSDFKNQPLSFRCMVVPVLVHKCSLNLDPKSSQLGTRLLEPV